MERKNYFLFDLDGTVTDTGEGIMNSAQYALDAFGIHNEPEAALRRFIGPPLDVSFREFYGMTETQALGAIEKYRERYRAEGIFESPLYPGMLELLRELSQSTAVQGGNVCLATSKPLYFARQILKLRNVEQYFSVITGANMDGTMTDKAQVIGEALRQLGNPPKEKVVMVGDRRQDILGAHTQGLESIGAGYGYGEPGELEAAGASKIVSTVEELKRLCLCLCTADV